MKKYIILMLSLTVMLGAVGCGAKENGNAEIIGGADGPTSIFLASNAGEQEPADDIELSIPGTWQTASVGYVDGDDMQPDYYVRFTDAEIVYGHMKDGTFALDHSDEIREIEKTDDGRYKVKAESAEGVQYTYCTSETDTDVLEYYETWNEDEFSDMYRGGASLSKMSP